MLGRQFEGERRMIILKKAGMADLEAILELENLAFPKEEREDEKRFVYRMENYGWWFRKAMDGDQMAAYLCARPVEETGIKDGMYLPQPFPEGDSLAILSLAVHPQRRGKGMGEFLLKDLIYLCREEGMKRVILACKKELIPYYNKLGFVEAGLSQSTHGGAVWYDMKLDLSIPY